MRAWSSTPSRGRGPTTCLAPRTTSSPGPWRLRPHGGGAPHQADPARAAGSAAARPTPRRCCAGRAAPTRRSRPGLGADVPFCVVGGRARVEGVGERVTPLPFEARDYLLLLPPFGVDTAAVYRAWDEDPADDGAQRAGGGRPGRRAPPGRAGATPWATWPAPSRRWPAAARPGSSREARRRRGRPSAAGAAGGGRETARLVRARTVPAGWEGD